MGRTPPSPPARPVTPPLFDSPPARPVTPPLFDSPPTHPAYPSTMDKVSLDKIVFLLYIWIQSAGKMLHP